ncbi:MAG: spermidine synthase [Verrucomicrobiota bacterium]
MPRRPQFEELDYQQTPMGDLILQRRTILSLDGLDVFEVKLGDEYLMSSLFTSVEIALADLGVAAAARSTGSSSLKVVVGGLGLGYTARAVLGHESVESLLVVELFEPVIKWHREGMVPLGSELHGDERCRLIHGDFFQCAATEGFDPREPERKFHAVLLDIDHSPRHLLSQGHGPFYEADGLRQLQAWLYPGGVFGLWSNDPPDPEFLNTLEEVFESSQSEEVSFPNPLQDGESQSTVYLATTET